MRALIQRVMEGFLSWGKASETLRRPCKTIFCRGRECVELHLRSPPRIHDAVLNYAQGQPQLILPNRQDGKTDSNTEHVKSVARFSAVILVFHLTGLFTKRN
jgi:hypothetical protein